MEHNENIPPYILELESKISLLFRTVKERHVHDASDAEISMPQFFCMFVLSRCGKQKMSEIASNLALSYASATNLINRLSEAEYVNRYDDPEDRRVVMVELSEKGDKVMTSVREKHINEMKKRCESLPKKDLETLLNGMDILIKIVSPT